MTSSSERKFGVILQYLQMGLSTIISLAFTPIMLRILGSNEYGIYNLASSIISYLTLLSLGFGSSYLHFYNLYKSKDEVSVPKLNGLYMIVFIIMGIIALIAGIIISFNVKIFYNDTYSYDELKIAKVLTFFLAINLAISFPASLFVSYIVSQEKFIFQKLINMIKTIIGPITNIILLYLGFGSIGMVVSTTCISLSIDFINLIFCFKKLSMKFTFKKLDWRILKNIGYFSLFIAINQVIDQINWQTDKIILGKMINGAAVAIYSVGSTINTMFTQFSTAVSSVFAPKVNELINSCEANKNEKLTYLFIKVGRIQWFILFLILSGFVFFGRFFIIKWAGAEYENAYYVSLLLMVPAIVPLIQNLGIEIQTAMNKHQFRSIIYLIMAIMNIGMSIFFCHLWGVIGTAIGTTISLVVANGIIMNIYYHKVLKINIIMFWKSILSTLNSLLIPLIIGILLMVYYKFNGIIDFIIIILLYTLVYCLCLFFIGMNDEEHQLLRDFKNKIIRKKR